MPVPKDRGPFRDAPARGLQERSAGIRVRPPGPALDRVVGGTRRAPSRDLCAFAPKGLPRAASRSRRERSRRRLPLGSGGAARRAVRRPGTVAFSADRGVYRVLLGSFSDRSSAEALAERLRGAGRKRWRSREEPRRPPRRPLVLNVTVEDGSARRLLSPADIYPADADARVLLDAKPYRGSLRVLVNPRGLVTVVNRVDLEAYLYGVVPAEMGPKRYDELEALKAQTVAARTYVLAHRGQFESEGYDVCGTARCQVYSGFSAEDPLSNAAVESTRGLVLAFGGRFADALFISTCGGRTENVENVFGEPAVPYLVAVECSELAASTLPGAALDGKTGPRPRTGLEWRGSVLAHHVPGSARAARRCSRPRRNGRGWRRKRRRPRRSLPLPSIRRSSRHSASPPRGLSTWPRASRATSPSRHPVSGRLSGRRPGGLRFPPSIPFRCGRDPSAARPDADRRGVRGPPLFGRAAAGGRDRGDRDASSGGKPRTSG